MPDIEITDELNREIYIKRLQNSIKALRSVAGWSAQELSDMLGVTKQTMSNLENGKTPMSKIQSIAITALFEAEAAKNSNLKILMESMLDVNRLNKDDLNEILEEIERDKKGKVILQDNKNIIKQSQISKSDNQINYGYDTNDNHDIEDVSDIIDDLIDPLVNIVPISLKTSSVPFKMMGATAGIFLNNGKKKKR